MLFDKFKTETSYEQKYVGLYIRMKEVCKSGDINIVKKMLIENDLEYKKLYNNCLKIAIENKHPKVAKLLLMSNKLAPMTLSECKNVANRIIKNKLYRLGAWLVYKFMFYSIGECCKFW